MLLTLILTLPFSNIEARSKIWCRLEVLCSRHLKCLSTYQDQWKMCTILGDKYGELSDKSLVCFIKACMVLEVQVPTFMNISGTSSERLNSYCQWQTKTYATRILEHSMRTLPYMLMTSFYSPSILCRSLNVSWLYTVFKALVFQKTTLVEISKYRKGMGG